MHFLLVLKKTREAPLDSGRLASNEAPSYPADAHGHVRTDHLELFTYFYGYAVPEDQGRCVSLSEGVLRLAGGIYACMAPDAPPPGDLSAVVDRYEASRRSFEGDYLVLKLDRNGDGFVGRPAMSFTQLFFYEDEECQALATEIGLIVSGLKKFAGRFGDHFDYRYIRESIFSEWAVRRWDEATAFRRITRILPFDTLTFRGFSARVERSSPEIAVPADLELLYETDRDAFYERVFSTVEGLVESYLPQLRGEKIELSLTGGLDSRCTLAAVFAACRESGIELVTSTGGGADHPDVVIAKRIAAALGLRHEHVAPGKEHDIPRSEADYRSVFRISHGDWNANNFRTSNEMRRSPRLTGQDNYKRLNRDQMVSMNRWYARRMADQQTLPVLATDVVNACAALYGRHDPREGPLEFVHSLLERFAPELLEIPFAGHVLPRHPVEPYMTVAATKSMPNQLAEAYFDLQLVRDALGPVFRPAWLSLGAGVDRIVRRAANRVIRSALKPTLRELDSEDTRRIAMGFACAAQMDSFH